MSCDAFCSCRRFPLCILWWRPGKVSWSRMRTLDPDPRLTVHIAEMEPSSLSRNLWYYRELPKLAARVQADIVHLTYPMPVDGAAFACPTVVTLHDLYPYEIPQNFGYPKCIFNRVVLQQCLRNVDSIACVSEITDVLLRRYAPAATFAKSRPHLQLRRGGAGLCHRVAHPRLAGRAIPSLCCAAPPQQEHSSAAPDLRSPVTAQRDR